MTEPDRTLEIDSVLLDLEGILHALDLIRFGDALNKPGKEFHALAVLAHLAVEQVGKLRLAIFPNEPLSLKEGDAS